MIQFNLQVYSLLCPAIRSKVKYNSSSTIRTNFQRVAPVIYKSLREGDAGKEMPSCYALVVNFTFCRESTGSAFRYQRRSLWPRLTVHFICHLLFHSSLFTNLILLFWVHTIHIHTISFQQFSFTCFVFRF